MSRFKMLEARLKSFKPTFFYFVFQEREVEGQIKLNIDYGSFFKSLNVRGIKELLVVRAPKRLEDKFDNIVLKHRRKRELNSLQNQKLSALRDWLLPMLMNGQVRVAHSHSDGNLEDKILKQVQDDKLWMVAEDGEIYTS